MPYFTGLIQTDRKQYTNAVASFTDAESLSPSKEKGLRATVDAMQRRNGVSGKHYADYLTAAEMSDITRLFQQRHLLAHTDGMVDQDYIMRSGDSSCAFGQRIVVRENSVRELLAILRKLTDGMSKDCLC